MMEFIGMENATNIIKVIGVGGGGSNAVNHMYRQGITGVDFIVCNTDNQALALSPVPTKIQLGPGLTEGRGAGSLPNVGKEACLESVEDIRRLLQNNTRMLFITAGMGGGTGTGAAPIIAGVAKEMGILTVGIVTIPFQFEGRRRISQATQGLDDFKANVDTLIVIANERLREIYGDLALRDAFSNADNVLTTAAKAIAEIITVPGYINVDFADVNTVMRDSGVAIMGVGVAEGPDRARHAIDMALNSPLLEDNNIQGAQHILLNISSGTREVTMDEIMEITDFVQDEAGDGTDVIWGNCYNEDLGDRISVTLIATGFHHNEGASKSDQSKDIVIPLEGDFSGAPTGGRAMGALSGNTVLRPGTTIDLDTPGFTPPNTAGNRQTLTTKTPPQPATTLRKINTPKAISELENEPAFVRKGIMLDDTAHSSEQHRSRTVINTEDEPNLFSSVPFLNEKDGID